MTAQYFLLLLCVVSHFACAQGYEGKPCTSKPFPKQLLAKGELADDFFISDCDFDRGQASSSFLKASGKSPAMGAKDDPDGNSAYDAWTCMYAGGSAVDNNTLTAWVEGVNGDGKGEVLLVTQLELTKKVEIHAGFGKSQALYNANNRPRTIKTYIVQAKPKAGGQSQCGSNFDALKIIASTTQVLNDVNQFQPLLLPAFKRATYSYDGNTWDYQYWMMIELVDVYRGTKYQDTCISEIRNVNQ